ncbi:MAG: ammonium transporter [Clostridiales bacterium]|nr:ammonium transporter [Clostridiales bacterium]MDY2729562.1 ammonium transporter [Clostridium sp.]
MDGIYSSVDTIWVLLGAVLVFFMQAGFAMVETGLTRAKNAGNIIMKNLMDFCLGTIIFWILGFGLMFGTDIGGIIGVPDFFIQGNYGVEGSYTSYAYVIFQTVFCATSATIVSGAMAERTKFSSYLIYSFLISAIIYPISGHWIWGGGWLAQLGFHDFAGSTAVHMVGGVSALVGAKILGPRIGKYDKYGKPKAIPGHNLTIAALGVFILWFCWFGFNGGSTVSATGDDTLNLMGSVFMTTNIAAAVATAAVLFITWIRYKKPDVSMTLNGSLAGLVAITAGCDIVSPFGAAIIGLIAAFVVVFGIEFIDKVLKIDDPVGAIGVHGLCGATGTILAGFFSVNDGLLYGHGFKFLGIQCLGVISVIAWVLVTMTIIFLLIKKFNGLRVSREEEIVGLDLKEHGLVSCYADFMPSTDYTLKNTDNTNITSIVKEASTSSSKEGHITVEKSPDGKDTMTNITVFINQDKLALLRDTLENLGITGMNVTHVLGCGMQKGHAELYRGAELDTVLLPKVKVEIVVCKVPVDIAINSIKKVLRTGNIGDGKIFVYNVQNCIKIRTGEEGYDALQDE